MSQARAWAIAKVLVSVALIAGATLYLLGGSLRGSLVYDLTVDELVGEREDIVGEQVRVGGRLVASSHQITEGTTDHQFTIQGAEHSLNVRYTGLWPDAATDGRELMIEGVLGDDGVVDAQRVLARCPSRYKRRVEEGVPGS